MEPPSQESDSSGLTSYHVGRARAGDRESLDWIVRRLSPLLLGAVSYRLGRRLRELYDPEDIVSDVWLAVLPRLGELHPRDGRVTPVLLKYISSTVIFRINNLLEKHIKGKPRRAVAPGGERSTTFEPVANVADAGSGQLTRLVRGEAASIVSDAIAALPEKDRELVVLRGIEQRPYKEIASIVGRDHKVLAVEYQRALEKLRRKIPGSVFDELHDE